MKNLFIKAFLCIGLFSVNYASFSQDLSIVKVFKEFPDKYIKLNESGIAAIFTKDVREFVLNERHSDMDKKRFAVSGYTITKELNNIEVEEYEDDFYEIVINEKQNHINCNYWNEVLTLCIDFIIFEQGETYKILILEDYAPGMGNPSFRYISEYIYDKSNQEFVDNQILFPSVKWSDFYSSRAIKVLNMDYLKDVELPIFIQVTEFNNKLCMIASPDLVSLTNMFVGSMDHKFILEPNYIEDLELTFTALGFADLPDFKPVYFSLPEFIKVSK